MINNTQGSDAASVFSAMNAAAQAGTNKSVTAAAATQDRFLKLLVTQMKNQDPLNPMDNAQVTSQMAQLSTVTGIDKMNATLQALSDSMSSNQSLQAATMIGHGVLVPGEAVALTNGAAYGGAELPQSVDAMKVSIYDKAGTLVNEINLGAQKAGLVNWQWDGRTLQGAKLPDGAYSFKLTASQAGVPVAAKALEFGMVTSVAKSAQGVELSVGNRAGIALSDVRQIV